MVTLSAQSAGQGEGRLIRGEICTLTQLISIKSTESVWSVQVGSGRCEGGRGEGGVWTAVRDHVGLFADLRSGQLEAKFWIGWF